MFQKWVWPLTFGMNCSSNLKYFANSRPLDSHFKSFFWSLQYFFLAEIQNNFENKMYLHCKYIQCNFYTFYLCPTFHCNPTVLFTFILQVKWKNVNPDLQWITIKSTLLHCNEYGKILVTFTLFYRCLSFHYIYLFVV